jgi:hypothetical protein
MCWQELLATTIIIAEQECDGIEIHRFVRQDPDATIRPAL